MSDQASNPMDVFATRDRANAGTRIELRDPLGNATEHWFQILSTDSDAFRYACLESDRRIALSRIGGKDNTPEQTANEGLQRIASLVTAWSFPQECTKQNVVAFLRSAPYIADAVDRLAADRQRFFAQPLSS